MMSSKIGGESLLYKVRPRKASYKITQSTHLKEKHSRQREQKHRSLGRHIFAVFEVTDGMEPTMQVWLLGRVKGCGTDAECNRKPWEGSEPKT